MKAAITAAMQSALEPKPASPPTGNVVEALEFYRDEATAAQKAMSGTPNPDAMTAILTVLSLDNGKRATAALATLQPADPVEPKVSSDVENYGGFRFVRAGSVTEEQREQARGLYALGDCKLIWANEGDLGDLLMRPTTLRASDPGRELVERAYYEGWRIGSQRALGQGPSNTAAQDWLDSDTLAALAQGQSDTKGEGHE